MLCISIAKVHSFNGVIPIFHNLTNLQINSLNYRWSFLVQVLKHCPMLQELCVDEAGPDATEETWTQKDDKENFVASSTCELTVHNVPFDDASEPDSPLDANEPDSPLDANEPNSPLDASGSSGGSNV
ncbi:hypothetical protein P8452_75207 [Trifolium repens]|nr:hypothetical protein P8452_75207 [Trifolium repens]